MTSLTRASDSRLLGQSHLQVTVNFNGECVPTISHSLIDLIKRKNGNAEVAMEVMMMTLKDKQ